MSDVAAPAGARREARRVIDSHTHAFSPDLLKNRDRVADADLWFGQLYADPKAAAVDATAVSEATAAAGIERAIICGFPWSDEGRCREENAYFAEAVANDERLEWLGIVVPGDPDAARDAEWCLEHGAVGIGELNADGQRAPLDEPDLWRPLIEVVRNANRPLLLHASEAPGHVYPGKGTATPDRLARWLEQAQEIDVVFAHWGGGLPFYELMPEIQRLTRRVAYDCAATTYLYRFDVFPRVIDLVGADRVLFGSDYPLLRQDRLLARSRAMLRGDDEARLVLAENAARIFGLDRAHD